MLLGLRYRAFAPVSSIGHIFRLLATDSAGAFPPAREFGAMALGGSTRLGAYYLRGFLRVLCLSYAAPPFDVSAVGGNPETDRSLIARIAKENRCVIWRVLRKGITSLIYVMKLDKGRCARRDIWTAKPLISSTDWARELRSASS